MKISREAVCEMNKDFISGFVPNIRKSDNGKAIAKEAGSKVIVDPDNKEATSIMVEFHPNVVFAVTRGATMEEIAALLKGAAFNGAFGSLGVTVDSMVPGGLGNATLELLKKICSTESEQDNIILNVPVQLKGTEEGKQISMTGKTIGWTKTTDWDGNEFANIKYYVELDGLAGNKIVTENVSTESQIPIHEGLTKVKKVITDSSTIGAYNAGYQLETDGGFFSDTISLIQIETITLWFYE